MHDGTISLERDSWQPELLVQALHGLGLTADAPIKAVQEFRDKFQARFKYLPDHNGIKGYTAVYAVKAATEKLGKFDRKALAKSLHGMTITPTEITPES